MPFPTNYKPLARPELLFRELNDGGIIYEPQTDTIHTLNATGSFIWVLCDGEHTLQDILNLIKQHFQKFEVSPEEAVSTAIEQFQQLNLLAPADAPVSNR